METIQRQHEAAGLIVDLVSSRLGQDQGVHPETAIVSTARLAGCMLLRSFQFDLDKHDLGSILLSPEANEKGPLLINVLGTMLENFGITLDESKLGTERGEDPKLSYLETMDTFQTDVLRILENTHLEYEDGAIAIGMATAFIVKECSQSIGAEIGFNAGVYGFIEGAKTIPPLPSKVTQ